MIVEDEQLSLAIGKRGQNVRLAAELIGSEIDIKSETDVKDEVADALAKMLQVGVAEVEDAEAPEAAAAEAGDATAPSESQGEGADGGFMAALSKAFEESESGEGAEGDDPSASEEALRSAVDNLFEGIEIVEDDEPTDDGEEDNT